MDLLRGLRRCMRQLFSRNNPPTQDRAWRLTVEGLEDRAVPAANFATHDQVAAPAEQASLVPPSFVANELLVQFAPGIDQATRDAALARVGGTVKEHIRANAISDAALTGDLALITLPQWSSLTEAIGLLNSAPGVEYAEANWIVRAQYVSDDPSYVGGNLWGMYGDQTNPANGYGSQAGEAWERGYIGSSSVAVGIVDEGIDFNHPDLAGNMWTNPGEIADNGIDDDGNGYADDIHGWDFFNDDATVFDGTPGSSVDRHGTHVAGTIGAIGGNATGVAGVAWRVKMISAKFLGPGGGSLSDAVRALDYLTNLKTLYGVNVVASNNSWGGGGFSQSLQNAITRAANAGILFVAAAGNDGQNNDVSSHYPSNYSTLATAGYDNVIAVAAISSSGNLATFSNYGATKVDLGAPGVNIRSTLPFGGYGSLSGTSMAAPHVTGAVVIYAAANPNATAEEIRDTIL